MIFLLKMHKKSTFSYHLVGPKHFGLILTFWQDLRYENYFIICELINLEVMYPIFDMMCIMYKIIKIVSLTMTFLLPCSPLVVVNN